MAIKDEIIQECMNMLSERMPTTVQGDMRRTLPIATAAVIVIGSRLEQELLEVKALLQELVDSQV